MMFNVGRHIGILPETLKLETCKQNGHPRTRRDTNSIAYVSEPCAVHPPREDRERDELRMAGPLRGQAPLKTGKHGIRI